MSLNIKIPLIRRATIQDAIGIHKAHMLSIREICSKDHSAEEIQAWGYLPYLEEQRIKAISNDLVWVVEDNNAIEGYGHLRVYEKEGLAYAHIFGLYLTLQVCGKSLGKVIIKKMMDEINKLNVKSITLESTISAKNFYLKMGFVNNGPETTIKINGTPIRCFPMKMVLIRKIS